MEISDKHVIITGGASGIGLAIANTFLSLGAHVCVFDIDGEAIESLPSTIIGYHCDCADENQVSACIETLLQEWQSIDILINNAGGMHYEPLIETINDNPVFHSIQSWHSVISNNLTTAFVTGLNVIKAMIDKASAGVIINISSVTAGGAAKQSAYSAAKAGVESLTKAWSRELGKYGIRCLAIAPGLVSTEKVLAVLSERQRRKWVANNPLQRAGSIDEIVKAIVFAVENDYVNGVVLPVNGGQQI